MIDTGAAPNLIKSDKILNTQIDIDSKIFLTGITEGRIETLGRVTAVILGRDVAFHVVSPDFPISCDGILGADFLRDTGKINFVEQIIEWHGATFPFLNRETVKIPGRTSVVMAINVMNTDVNIGYVPRLQIKENVYLGEAIVTNRAGKAYLRAYNTSNDDVILPAPVVELQEFDTVDYPSSAPSSTEPLLETGTDPGQILAIAGDPGSRADEVRKSLRCKA